MTDRTEELYLVTLPRHVLNRLYAIAYHDGHEDTVEGRYVHVLIGDSDTYHHDTVQILLDEMQGVDP